MSEESTFEDPYVSPEAMARYLVGGDSSPKHVKRMIDYTQSAARVSRNVNREDQAGFWMETQRVLERDYA